MSSTQQSTTHYEDVVTTFRPIEELVPRQWASDKVLANGIHQHYYRTGGDGPPLVLLHGILDGALTWLRTARALEADFDVIMVDGRGQGHSDRIATRFSQELLTEDAAGLIRALRLHRPRLLGHSQGGMTAIHVADQYPELVHSIMVEGWSDAPDPQVANVDFASSPHYQAWFDGYLAWLERLKTESHRERMLSALSQLPPGTPLLPEEEYVPWVENCANLDLELVRFSMTLWPEVPRRIGEAIAALRRITSPVLIMKSGFFPTPGATPYVQQEDSDQPNIKIVRFENTGHLVHRDQFDRFMVEVRAFLDSRLTMG